MELELIMKLWKSPLFLGVLAGIVLLTASVAGSRLAPSASEGGTPSARAAVPNSDRDVSSSGNRRAVCIGYVDVETGVTPLYPLQPGRVDKVLVKENEEVKAGVALLRIDRRAAEAMLRQAEAALDAAKVQLEQAGTRTRQQELREAQQELAVAALQHKLEAAEALLARREELQSIQSSAREIEAARAQVAELMSIRDAEKAKLEELRLNKPKWDMRRADADVRAREAQRDQAKLAVEECDLRAPVDGTVLRVLASQGETLGSQPRQPAMLFCPQGPRIVRAEVEQEFARRVAVGQKATIQDDTISGERWTGRVSRLSDWYTQRRSIIAEPLQYNDVRTMECIVTVDPKQPPLRIGQRVRVVLGSD